MQINGEWRISDDGIVRPVIRGQVRAADGTWAPVPFLVDTGADCTAISANILAALSLPHSMSRDRIGGLGGLVRSVAIDTAIQLFDTSGSEVTFNGQFAAVTDLEALDMSVLGRDVLGLFAVIVDQPGDAVCLVRQRHRYTIAAS